MISVNDIEIIYGIYVFLRCIVFRGAAAAILIRCVIPILVAVSILFK